ncbi:MAG: IPTL-CTERM sorting domain-containing protein [Desulfosalsimonadaceae bacterium]|nr:IPTL-CTERM sorting domain-containing protein [Desulfosalsimonadaceae bacterium]
MKKRQGKIFLSFLFVLFLLFGSGTAYACLFVTDVDYSTDGVTWDDDGGLDVCEGDTLYLRVSVAGHLLCGGSGDDWESSSFSYRFGGNPDPFVAFIDGCDSTPNYNNDNATHVFSVTVPALPAGSSPQTMDIQVRIYNEDSCSDLDDTAVRDDVINVYRNPDATITNGDDSVCAGATGLTASVADAGAGATYAWGVTGGTITGGQGTSQVTWTAGAAGMATVSVDVTTAAGCTAQDTADVTVNALPVCDITVDTAVCAGTADLTASVASAGEGATYTWGITNGTITAGEGTSQITWTAGAVSPVTITVDITDSNGCTCSDTADVTVNALPVCDITADDAVCAGTTGLAASVASAGEGATYTWGITNGTITAGDGTNEITWTAGAVSPVTLTINITDSNGCTCSDSVDVTVNPLPLGCTITAPATVDFGSTGNTASITEGPTPGAAYAWVIFVDGVLNNGLITAGQNSSQITWTAPVSFTQIDIGVTVTTDQGCVCENDPPVGGGTGGVVVTGTGQAGSIPTLSEWGMIILGLLVAGTAVIAMRRKNDMTV